MEIRARIGESPTVVWRAPRPVAGTPVLTVRVPDAPIDVDMTPINADVTAIGPVGRERDQLTITEEAPNLTGRQWGAAFLLADDDYPIQVVSVDGSTLTLGSTLPRRPVIPDAGAAIQYATWSAAIPVAATAEARRAIGLEIAYQPAGPVAISQRAAGVLHVLTESQVPFDSGLDHFTFIGALPRWREMLPKTAASFDEAIDLTRISLIGDLRRKLLALPTRPSEDDIADGSALRLAHTYRTAALLALDGDQRRAMMAAYSEELNRAVALLAIDLDSNGEISTSEAAVEVAGPHPPPIQRRTPCPRFTLPERR